MFDPKAAGEEADKMISSLNQPPVEDQGTESVEAIVQDEPTSNDDQGVSSNTAPSVQDDTSKKLEQLSRQAEAAEQRWKVLQGMIDKKDTEIETLRTLLAQMNTGPQAADSVETQNALITKEDHDAFGGDLIDMVNRVTRATLASDMPRLLKAFDDRLARLEGSVQGVQQVTAKTAQDMFFDALTSRVSDWEAVNVDQGFLSWLNEEDQFTGATRMELLQHAFGKQDVPRTAAFFQEYKRLVAPEVEPARENKVAKLVAPGKAKTTASRVETGSKRTWTRTEIAKLYADKREGRISAKQFDELERDIFAAQSDGRIAA
jgi:hypothetical protein